MACAPGWGSMWPSRLCPPRRRTRCSPAAPSGSTAWA